MSCFPLPPLIPAQFTATVEWKNGRSFLLKTDMQVVSAAPPRPIVQVEMISFNALEQRLEVLLDGALADCSFALSSPRPAQPPALDGTGSAPTPRSVLKSSSSASNLARGVSWSLREVVDLGTALDTSCLSLAKVFAEGYCNSAVFV